MFKKNNMKCIIILALGFFWCSSLYLTQEQYLTKFADINFVNISELLFGSLSMAVGILTFGLLYRNNKNMKKYYIIFMLLSIVSMISFFATDNNYFMSVCLCLSCFFGTAGFGAGYHFSLLSCSVEKEYRGRVFAIGYGLGSIGTYLITYLPDSFYISIYSLLLYIPILLLNLYLVIKYTNLSVVNDEKLTSSFKNYFLRISIIVLAMSLLSALSTDTIALFTIDIPGGYGATRLYYCMGLLFAGFLADRKNSLFEILTISSFIFSLLAIILLKENYSVNIVAGLSYSFVAFFVLYRTMIFVNVLDKKKNMIWVSAFGLMYSRIVEGSLIFFEDNLMEHYTFLIIVISICLSLVIILYFMLYYRNSNMSDNDAIKNIAVKYKLGIQEEKVFNLLMRDYSNQEIANELYVSVNTVRNHVASIYKKTGMKKKELKEKCLFKNN